MAQPIYCDWEGCTEHADLLVSRLLDGETLAYCDPHWAAFLAVNAQAQEQLPDEPAAAPEPELPTPDPEPEPEPAAPAPAPGSERGPTNERGETPAEQAMREADELLEPTGAPQPAAEAAEGSTPTPEPTVAPGPPGEPVEAPAPPPAEPAKARQRRQRARTAARR